MRCLLDEPRISKAFSLTSQMRGSSSMEMRGVHYYLSNTRLDNPRKWEALITTSQIRSLLSFTLETGEIYLSNVRLVEPRKRDVHNDHSHARFVEPHRREVRNTSLKCEVRRASQTRGAQYTVPCKRSGSRQLGIWYWDVVARQCGSTSLANKLKCDYAGCGEMVRFHEPRQRGN